MAKGIKHIHNYRENFNTTISIIDRMSIEKINKDIEYWNHIINQLDLTDAYETPQPKDMN